MVVDSSEVIDTATVSDLSPDEKPNLSLVTGSHEVAQILDYIGASYDNDSIVREDSYHSLWVDVSGGEYVEVSDSDLSESVHDTNPHGYVEVWACHYTVPCMEHTVYRLV